MGVGHFFGRMRRRFRPSARTIRTIAGAGAVAVAPFMTPSQGTVARRRRRPSGPSGGSGITPANAFPILQEAVQQYRTSSDALRGLASLADDIFPSSSISHMPEGPGPGILSSTNSNPLMPFRGASTTNRLATRAAKKVSGRKALRGMKGKRKLRVSRKLRKKIKQVVEADKLYGEYHTTRIGQIGLIRDKDSNAVIMGTTTNAGGYGNTAMYTIMPNNVPFDWRIFWSGMCAQGIVVDPGDDFQFFTPLKIWDAASVLWNEKGPNKDYAQQAGNIVMQVDSGTGIPVSGGTSSNPNAQLLQIHLHNSYVEFEITNLSNRRAYLKLYFCVPRVKAPEQLPLATLDSALRQETSGSNTAYLRAGTTFGGTQTQNDSLLTNPSFHPAKSAIFNATYKYETVEITIQPQETVLHSLQGPKNITFDYNKFFNSNVDLTGRMWNKSSVSLMIEVVYDMQTLATAQQAGRLQPNATILADDILGFPIAIEMRETFKLSMPDNIGFIQRVATAGVAMPLNMRKKIICYGNYAHPLNLSDTVPSTYSIRNDEDPLLSAVGSIFG